MCKKESVIHIDSRHRNSNSTSSSNMTVNLEHGFYIYDHASIQIKSVHIPNTLKTINRDINDKLYCLVDSTYQTITLQEATYDVNSLPDLRTDLDNKLNTAFGAGTITVHLLPNSASTATNKIVIFPTSATSVLKIFTDFELKHNPDPAPYNRNNLQTANELMKNGENISPAYTSSSPFERAITDFQPIESIYVSFNSLPIESFSSCNRDSLLKRLVVSNNDDLVSDDSTKHKVNVRGNHQLTNLSLQICDIHGNVIDLNNRNWSASLLIQQ